MMMNAKLFAGVSILALTLGACASDEPKPLVETPEVIYKTEKVNAAVANVPAWYKEMPEKKGLFLLLVQQLPLIFSLQLILQH